MTCESVLDSARIEHPAEGRICSAKQNQVFVRRLAIMLSMIGTSRFSEYTIYCLRKKWLFVALLLYIIIIMKLENDIIELFL